MLRRLLLAALMVLPLAVMLAPGTATAATTAACTDGIAITQFSFSPGTIEPGQTSTLTLTLQNCGGQAVQGSSTWIPQFTWAGTGRPPGCPVMDPVAFSFSLAPGATATQALGLGDPIASCEATGITATVNVSVSGVTGTAATATASLVITQRAAADCHVPYTPDTWPGFSVNFGRDGCQFHAYSNRGRTPDRVALPSQVRFPCPRRQLDK